MAGSSYLYQPSTAVAGVACVIFGINALLALLQAFRKRAWIWLIMVLALLSKPFLAKNPSSNNLANTQKLSGMHWFCSSNQVCHRYYRPKLIHCSVFIDHAGPGIYGWCYIRRIWADCLPRCPG